MATLNLIPQAEFERIRSADIAAKDRLTLLADMCRANTLVGVKKAGSGHLGSSLSSLDIVVLLFESIMNTRHQGFVSPDRDIFFSSKGHDVPGFYAVLHSLGALTEDQFLSLRRCGGLDGHPDVGVCGVEANSGSLGMGLSKGRGMAWAKKRLGRGGRVFVMTGDGELQEGQIYEALQAGKQQGIDNLIAIVDHNKLQSDKPVNEITDLGDLEAKLAVFGWNVTRCDGHDFTALTEALDRLDRAPGPGILIADTIKGRGVSFMEHPRALKDGGGLYRWHAGAPNDDDFTAAHAEVMGRIGHRLAELGLEPLEFKDVTPQPGGPSGVSREYVADAYGQALIDLYADHPELVVLDGDLAADCRVREFELTHPEAFIENGIAEQDMVSLAGGLARQGLLPVVNTFTAFLASRANEQIYNNATELSKVIYAGHYSGLIPAGPGKSHQSIRDISLLGALPNLVMIQPANALETRQALTWMVEAAEENCFLRLIIGPSPRAIELPRGYNLTFGRGAALTEGGDALMIAYGPVMLHEALTASEILAQRGVGLRVINLPWLNRIDDDWLQEAIAPFSRIYVLEDHAPTGGLGDFLLGRLMDLDLLGGRKLTKLGVEGYPACGTPTEALKFHGLDGQSLAERVGADVG